MVFLPSQIPSNKSIAIRQDDGCYRLEQADIIAIYGVLFSFKTYFNPKIEYDKYVSHCQDTAKTQCDFICLKQPLATIK